MKTIIIGLGNPYLSDDGVGIVVSREIEKVLAAQNFNDHGVVVTEASVGGLRLMEMMVGYDQAILIDSLVSDGQPGTVRCLTLADLEIMPPTQHSASAHDANLPTAVAAGRIMGFALPDKIIIYAIECANTQTFGEELTTAVATVVPEVVTAVLEEITCLV